jgi:ribosomal protein S18 acetylase RimI-like enzyme
VREAATVGLLVRVLDATEWSTFRQLRLAALATDPEAFESTFAFEESLPDKEWIGRLSRRRFAFVDGERVGMVGWAQSEPSGSIELIGMWVRPDHRGTPTAALLVTEVQAIAVAEERSLALSVRADNPRARRFYEKCGFVVTGDVIGRRSGQQLLQMTWTPPMRSAATPPNNSTP